jgi:hypothetical protein
MDSEKNMDSQHDQGQYYDPHPYSESIGRSNSPARESHVTSHRLPSTALPPPAKTYPKLTLVTAENANIPIEIDLARQTSRLASKLNYLDHHDELVTRVPFRSEVVQMALEFCDHQRQVQAQRDAETTSNWGEESWGPGGWGGGDLVFDDYEFTFAAQEIEPRLVSELNAVSHFLGINRLLDLTTMKIMMMSADKSALEVQQMFGVQDASGGEDVVNALANLVNGLGV